MANNFERYVTLILPNKIIMGEIELMVTISIEVFEILGQIGSLEMVVVLVCGILIRSIRTDTVLDPSILAHSIMVRNIRLYIILFLAHNILVWSVVLVHSLSVHSIMQGVFQTPEMRILLPHSLLPTQ